MNTELSDTNHNSQLGLPCNRVALSRWVNEPLPAWQDILSAHDVARLTRRPTWILYGLALVGRFPRECQYRGRRIGWLRSDVLNWMTRELTIKASAPRVIARSYHRRERSSRQHCLPLDFSSPCGRSMRTSARTRSKRKIEIPVLLKGG